MLQKLLEIRVGNFCSASKLLGIRVGSFCSASKLLGTCVGWHIFCSTVPYVVHTYISVNTELVLFEHVTAAQLVPLEHVTAAHDDVGTQLAIGVRSYVRSVAKSLELTLPPYCSDGKRRVNNTRHRPCSPSTCNCRAR